MYDEYIVVRNTHNNQYGLRPVSDAPFSAHWEVVTKPITFELANAYVKAINHARTDRWSVWHGYDQIGVSLYDGRGMPDEYELVASGFASEDVANSFAEDWIFRENRGWEVWEDKDGDVRVARSNHAERPQEKGWKLLRLGFSDSREAQDWADKLAASRHVRKSLIMNMDEIQQSIVGKLAIMKSLLDEDDDDFWMVVDGGWEAQLTWDDEGLIHATLFPPGDRTNGLKLF